jgi:hypothetical protein
MFGLMAAIRQSIKQGNEIMSVLTDIKAQLDTLPAGADVVMTLVTTEE